MALSSPQSNNKLVQYTTEINREYVRENLFSPYMGTSLTSIIRLRNEPKKGGEQMNIPLVTRLTGTGKGVGQLTGNEEVIDNYGMRAWVDWARNAVATNKAEEQKDSADIFGEAKPLLSDWGKELQRDEIIAAMMALPSESQPAGLGSTDGQRVNGILYEDANASQRNTWNADNSDRVLYGNALGNYNATHATALATVDAVDDKFTDVSVQLLKYVAKHARPRIRPYKLEDGREYFVAFAGSNNFRQLKAAMKDVNKDARPRDVGSNPIFQDGDQIYDGVIIREIPEIDEFVDTVWTSLKTAGDTSGRVAPVFLCGQSAVAMPWAQMARPTFRDETDYGFIKGSGVEMCYGLAKVFKKHSSTKLVQFGMVTGFFSAAGPA
ncbi:phage capsid family protein [Kaistia sp. MMO-174]|uniref:phage capsid family protein n=1 Tax=Kaistia sp. MMO-174 TaxID=3081256 RepID=UPI00301990A0